jgi:hypothetical protein
MSAAAGTVYVIDCEIFIGTAPPIYAVPAPPRSAASTFSPKSLKSFGLNNNFTVPGGSVSTILPFTVAEQDQDLMASGNGFIIRTPGRYWISCSTLLYTWTITGYYFRLVLLRNGNPINYGSLYATSQNGTHINGTSYPTVQVTTVDDFIIGDTVTAGGAFDAASGQSVGIYFNVTQLIAVKIGD